MAASRFIAPAALLLLAMALMASAQQAPSPAPTPASPSAPTPAPTTAPTPAPTPASAPAPTPSSTPAPVTAPSTQASSLCPAGYDTLIDYQIGAKNMLKTGGVISVLLPGNISLASIPSILGLLSNAEVCACFYKNLGNNNAGGLGAVGCIKLQV
ncbi:hypothetical protein ACP4OV_011697 [Aristida adscensionis]